ncbi:NADAR family protein [Streptomyces sp. S3(2020)]|uniref:NADAR family protein n=1 Tax=Streptomyces sp. S3(2020) TaxID=2732044 RepID=UPI001487D01D|nr:NADAR family protein [Streptomyces sp. S3(2020)]NNN32135.1 NADAR family protein [Streptomyces sp. S3(2020)]
MTWRGPTYRTVDGERIEGAWCHVWRRHRPGGAYHVHDLVVYADGAIECERREPTDLEGLERRLADGLLAVRDPQAPPPPEQPSKWWSRWPEPCTADSFLLEVADRIEELSGRPTTAQRCHEAIRRYRQEPTEPHRVLLREAYLAVPAHVRIFLLGDMEAQDRPLRMLVTDVGEPADGDGPMVTEERHREILEYFDRYDHGVTERPKPVYADDPVEAGPPPVVLHHTIYPAGWPERLDLFVLRNDYPAEIHYAGVTYPSVHDGYWALAESHQGDDWPDVRLAVMAGLLRAKFTQHPDLAEILLATGSATISYTGHEESPYWRDAGSRGGRNWIGRLLELVRSELSWPTAE